MQRKRKKTTETKKEGSNKPNGNTKNWSSGVKTKPEFKRRVE